MYVCTKKITVPSFGQTIYRLVRMYVCTKEKTIPSCLESDGKTTYMYFDQNISILDTVVSSHDQTKLIACFSVEGFINPKKSSARFHEEVPFASGHELVTQLSQSVRICRAHRSDNTVPRNIFRNIQFLLTASKSWRAVVFVYHCHSYLEQ